MGAWAWSIMGNTSSSMAGALPFEVPRGVPVGLCGQACCCPRALAAPVVAARNC